MVRGKSNRVGHTGLERKKGDVIDGEYGEFKIMGVKGY